MGADEIKLCGSGTSTVKTQALSANGLHVKFCSDKNTAKGVSLLASKITGVVVEPLKDNNKREVTIEGQLPSAETSNKELDHVTCYYEYMMRVSQPDVPCPDDAAIKTVLQYHNHLMSVSSHSDGMCSGMTYPTNMMPMMNKIERCAVDYLYRTRDCKFAEMLVNSSNEELRSVAHAIIKNYFKTPRWMNTEHSRCNS